LTAAQSIDKPVVVDFIGYAPPGRQLGNVHFATTLSEAAEIATKLLVSSKLVNGKLVNNTAQAGDTQLPITNYFLRGLFSGGTLAYEALLMLQATLYPLFSNAPITNNQLLTDPFHSQAHTIIDLGGDEFTVGRLHPMLDNDLRIRRLRQEAADPEVAIILLDIVLGEGAHPDPAGELGPVIKEVIDNSRLENERLEIVAIVVGTEDDPQNLQSQIDQLTDAGAIVFRTTGEAVEYVTHRLKRFAPEDNPPVALDRFTPAPLAAINVGLESFYASLKSQGASVVQVDWRPPAGGNEKLAALLAKMKK
jgi:FdrA protein